MAEADKYPVGMIKVVSNPHIPDGVGGDVGDENGGFDDLGRRIQLRPQDCLLGGLS